MGSADVAKPASASVVGEAQARDVQLDSLADLLLTWRRERERARD